MRPLFLRRLITFFPFGEDIRFMKPCLRILFLFFGWLTCFPIMLLLLILLFRVKRVKRVCELARSFYPQTLQLSNIYLLVNCLWTASVTNGTKGCSNFKLSKYTLVRESRTSILSFRSSSFNCSI